MSVAAATTEIPGRAPQTSILFQGDSITDCDRDHGSDRDLGHGYVALTAAKLRDRYPERDLVVVNRGVSGNTVHELAARWQTDAIDLHPDIVNILIGVNDAASDMALAEFEAAYDALLAQTVKALPNTKIVLCEPFTLIIGPSTDEAQRWFAKVREKASVVEKLAMKYRSPFVRFQKVFDDASKRAPAEHWLPDGIHPTAAGHELLANEWIRAVATFYR